MTLLPPLLLGESPDVVGRVLGAAAEVDTRGHYAIAVDGGDVEHLVRDPFGAHKLFFAWDRESGAVATATFAIDLARAGHAFAAIGSAPPGRVTTIDRRSGRVTTRPFISLRYDGGLGSARVDEARAVRGALDAVMGRLRELAGERPVAVTLSGGLDSTTIAALARRVFPGLRAFTLVLDGPGSDPFAPGSDGQAAEHVARELGIPLTLVRVTPDDVLEAIDDALLYGQDYREFNVHCALVNVLVARALARSLGASSAPPWVLTGDGMNELLSDYTPVEYRGRLHYDLPDLPRSKLRRFLVAGLDAGDREHGVFARAGLHAVQPFLLAGATIAALSGAILDEPDAKSALMRAVMGGEVPEFVYSRPKVRAQVGSSASPFGTMGVLLDAGITEDVLAQRFERRFGIDPQARRGFIRGGVYRLPVAPAATS